jgi:hypothetical protein
LAVVLLVISGVWAYLGARLHGRIEPHRPGLFVGASLALVWLLAWVTFGVGALTYFDSLVQAVGNFTPPPSPISPVTDLSALIGFVAIMVLVRRRGWKVALGSAIVGMIAAPMIFELPFDLIVMSHIYPPPPPPTIRYTLLYFLPLFLVAISSYALLTVSPVAGLSRYTLFCLAAMFLVFAIWALLGFSYPSEPMTIGLNAVGKVLAFAAAVTLFVP